jgi:hypothetical protein
LETYFPSDDIISFDIQPLLFMGLILKEKEFRNALQQIVWEKYSDKIVSVFCSADAVIPVWAYMLIASALQPFAKEIHMGKPEQIQEQILLRNIRAIDISTFADQRVVIKGCGEIPIGENAYLEITTKLRPVVKSIMYGEPCSTVPVYKKK